MSRSRYWKLTADELLKFNYDEKKLLNWDMKCVRAPESEAIFIGVFLYRNGTPFDYESIKGITFFHNNIQKKEIPDVTKFLKSRFGGEELEKGTRIFLKGSKEIYSGKEIGDLAKEMESKFNTKATVTLEFENLTKEEMQQAGLPDSKLLPIPGK